MQLPVAPFDSNYPCAASGGDPFVSRDCLPQPGITNTAQFLDILSYRQRPTWRLAYRNFGKYEALVTNQSVNAGSPASPQAGVRWYEIRRTDGTYSVRQQSTYAPSDGIHRWMGSLAMDKNGDIGLGYSVVNGTDVFPGIRYTGRLAGDPLDQMTLGEATIIAGTGVQTTTNSRWGDYTSMNVDPVDDCTLWYVNEYYKESGAPAHGGHEALANEDRLVQAARLQLAGSWRKAGATSSRRPFQLAHVERVLPQRAEVETVEIRCCLDEEAHPLPALELLADWVEDLEVLVAVELPGEPEPQRFRRYARDRLDHMLARDGADASARAPLPPLRRRPYRPRSRPSLYLPRRASSFRAIPVPRALPRVRR